MTTDQILDQINQYLDQHVSGVRGALRQEPYIGDFFRMFAESQMDRTQGSEITGDGLVEAIGERSQRSDDKQHYQKKIELLRRLGAIWSEWGYAWDLYPKYHSRDEQG
jgi:hypothetical protein